eukprot:UN34872
MIRKIHSENLFDFVDVKQLKISELRGWFLGAELKEIFQDNIREWLAWAFYNCKLHEVPKTRKSELENLFILGTEFFGINLKKGYNPNIKSMRLTIDNIQSEHRPLIYYVFTTLIFDLITWVLYGQLGFRLRRSGSLYYWHRKGTDDGTNAPFVL